MSTRFDDEAAAWDSNIDIQQINQKVVEIVLPSLLKKSDSILELGCGTGVLTCKAVQLADSWLAIDTSSGMIKMLEAKLDSAEFHDSKIQTACMFLESPAQLTVLYTWAISVMTFHHIADMQATIDCLFSCVTKGLIIVDYEEWPGSRCFHPEDKMDGV